MTTETNMLHKKTHPQKMKVGTAGTKQRRRRQMGGGGAEFTQRRRLHRTAQDHKRPEEK